MLSVEGAVTVEVGRHFRPGLLREAHHLGTEPGHHGHRVRRHADRIEAVLEASVRARTHFRAHLLVVGSVAFDDAGLQGADDHFRGLVKAVPRLIHVHAEGVVLAPGETPADAEQGTALAQVIEHDHALHHPQGIMPRQNDRPGQQADVLGLGCHVAQVLQVVRRHGVVEEVVLDGAQGVEPQGLGQAA